jgi:hypothetical protein
MVRWFEIGSSGVFCFALAACSENGTHAVADPNLAGGQTSAVGSTGGQTSLTGSTGGVSAGTGGGATATGGAGGDGSTVRGSSVSFDGSHIQASIIARQIQPGAEQHVCVVVELPNPDDTWINQIHATLSGGSHHMIVDRQAAGTPLELDPQPCAPTMASDATRLMIAQQADTVIDLPSGAAFAIAAHQPLFLQLHYANVGTQVRDIVGTVDLTVAPPSDTAPIEADSIFTGSLAIDLPPESMGSSTSFFIPDPAAGTRHVFALTSHTHHLGVRSTIERVPSADAPPVTPIHVSTSWDDPPLTQFMPPLDFTGADGLRLTCNYNNTTDRTVTFGTATTDEMCFMWVYFYDE